MTSTNPEIIREFFPKFLKAKRKSLKITQEELAERANSAVRYIGHLEQGSRQPSLTVFSALAYALESSPSVMMQELEEQAIE